MFRWIPITNYHVWQLQKIAKALSILTVTVFIIGNIICAFCKDRVVATDEWYELKDGFPLFTDSDRYINILQSYPHNPGVKITFHTMRQGESFWDVARRNRISMETLIAANPILTTLTASEGTAIVVPHEDGVLVACDSITDPWRMSKKLEAHREVSGEYLPHFFEIFSLDDIRFVFFKKAVPVIVNDSLEKLYSVRRTFRTPVRGFYTSLYGDRVDPIFHGMRFHNGIDINARYGTPIRPVRKGIVNFCGWRDGYGYTIMIQHDEGYESLYGHCSKILVEKGDMVETSTVIGRIGSTGRSTGPHLHFTLYHHGKVINPILFVW